MRKRLFIFAAATCFALSAFATPAFAEGPSLPDEPTIGSEAHDGNEDGLLNGSDDGPTDDSSTVGGEQEKDNGNATPGANHDPVADGSAGSVMTLAGTSAVQNVQAWIDTNPAASTGRATFTLDGDFTTDQGLLFTGDSTAPADNRQTFIIDAQSHNITLNDYGIGATYCNVIIKDCNTLTIKAHRHPVSGVFDSACYFWHATLKLSNCTNVTIENDEKDQRASGISVYDEGSLYFENKTNVAISGYMAEGCSGIYMDRDDAGYDKIMGQIVVSNNSTLTATKCYHNGITANPVNVKVINYSEINVNKNGDATGNPYDYQGGIGSYYGTMTISDHSRVISENNASMFGIFVHNLDVDGTSEIESRYDTIYGIAFNGNTVLQSGAKMTSVGHWGPGIALYDFKDSKGSLTVQKNAVLSSSSTAVGLANGGNNFNVLPGAKVYLNDNVVGLDNYPNATTTVDAGAHLEICRNGAWGIKNGNSDIGSGTLVLNAGLITENNKLDSIPYKGNITFNVNDRDYEHKKYGGGIYNEYGTVSLSPLVKVYNNKAVKAGDDLYNADTKGYIFNIIALEPGAKWQVLDDDGKIIDDWYHDAEGKENRWKAITAKNNTVTDLPLGAALKAAHGINAPTPSPKPAEPTAAPTVAPTAAPADNTATAAPAAPAPTARPAVTATPAPTAQASGVIPQTGDSSSPALFSILTLGSITALCVLQKRRKSK